LNFDQHAKRLLALLAIKINQLQGNDKKFGGGMNLQKSGCNASAELQLK